MHSLVSSRSQCDGSRSRILHQQRGERASFEEGVKGFVEELVGGAAFLGAGCQDGPDAFAPPLSRVTAGSLRQLAVLRDEAEAVRSGRMKAPRPQLAAALARGPSRRC